MTWTSVLLCCILEQTGQCNYWLVKFSVGFLGGSGVKNPPPNAGEAGSIPGSVRSPGIGNGNPLQYSCLENSMNREAWPATVCGVAKSQDRTEQLNDSCPCGGVTEILSLICQP